MKKYETSNYQEIGGTHQPIVPNGSFIEWDEAQIATFRVQLAKGGSDNVWCTLNPDGTFQGTYEETEGYMESLTFSNFPPVPGVPVHAQRTDPFPDTDTGSFTATEVPPFDTER